MKLSIIVPVYKVEAFFDKCVESILAQTFTDFELILVDDGSPDNCGRMCDAWAEKDPRIRVLHKENGGLSDARNAGIEIAQGCYLGFVDSDDYIKPDMFETLIANLESYHADLSMCGYAEVYANRMEGCCEDRTVHVWDQKETVHQILLGKLLSVHACTKLFKRELFGQVRYPKGKVSEDAYVIMDILDQIHTAVFTPYTAYYYVQRNESIKTSAYSKRNLARIEAHQKNYTYICASFPEFRTLAYERYLGANAFVAGQMALSGVTERDRDCAQVFTLLRKKILRILTGQYFSARWKLAILVMVISKSLYRRLYRTAIKNV